MAGVGEVVEKQSCLKAIKNMFCFVLILKGQYNETRMVERLNTVF